MALFLMIWSIPIVFGFLVMFVLATYGAAGAGTRFLESLGVVIFASLMGALWGAIFGFVPSAIITIVVSVAKMAG